MLVLSIFPFFSFAKLSEQVHMSLLQCVHVSCYLIICFFSLICTFMVDHISHRHQVVTWSIFVSECWYIYWHFCLFYCQRSFLKCVFLIFRCVKSNLKFVYILFHLIPLEACTKIVQTVLCTLNGSYPICSEHPAVAYHCNCYSLSISFNM